MHGDEREPDDDAALPYGARVPYGVQRSDDAQAPDDDAREPDGRWYADERRDDASERHGASWDVAEG